MTPDVSQASDERDSPTWCDICEADYGGGSHYHCGTCHSKDVTSMMGHYSFGKLVCDPTERAEWIKQNVGGKR